MLLLEWKGRVFGGPTDTAAWVSEGGILKKLADAQGEAAAWASEGVL